MLINATTKTDSLPLPTVSPTVLEYMWVQPGLDIPAASRSWGEQQSTTATAPKVGIGGTEGVISEPKNGAKVGVGQPELPAPEEMWVQPVLDSPPASVA